MTGGRFDDEPEAEIVMTPTVVDNLQKQRNKAVSLSSLAGLILAIIALVTAFRLIPVPTEALDIATALAVLVGLGVAYLLGVRIRVLDNRIRTALRRDR